MHAPGNTSDTTSSGVSDTILTTCFRPDEASVFWPSAAAPSSHLGAGADQPGRSARDRGDNRSCGKPDRWCLLQRPRPRCVADPACTSSPPVTTSLRGAPSWPQRCDAQGSRRSGHPVGEPRLPVYQSPVNVLEMLVAYVHAGLEAHELCLLVTSPADGDECYTPCASALPASRTCAPGRHRTRRSGMLVPAASAL